MKKQIIINPHIFEKYTSLNTNTLNDDDKLELLIEAYKRTNNWQYNIDNLGGSFSAAKESIIKHPTTHYTLIAVIKLFDDSDPIDAAKDIGILQALFDAKINELQ